ncbi:MAG TPA: hypothetical protein QGH16_00900, partial [Verrucomicrobiota bacterium]|nr:hypothetical protein [Verrucomicrobiota bacterium]
VTRTGRMTTKTNEFFLEKSMRIDFSSKESDIVNFLWKLGGSDSMVRVSEMRVRPDKNRYRLDGWMNLTASYQKDPKAARTRPPAEAKPAPVAAKPSEPEDKPKPEPSKRDAKKPKPSGGKRTIPSRPVRKTQ